MRFLVILLSGIILSSCAESVDEKDLQLLEGYWEIEEVIFPDGNRKTYGLNTTIDYFKYENRKGYRKKVQPRLNGSYMTSDDAVSFSIVEKNGKFILVYENELSQWEELIRSLSNEKLILEGNEDVVYHYKRFEAILDNIGGEEK